MALGAKALHWTCALLTVPAGILLVLFPNPEKLKIHSERVSIKLPGWILGFCGTFVHLTVVSHELTAGYFVLTLLRDHGFIPAHEAASGSAALLPNDWLEVYFAVAAGMGIFIATVFWGAVLIDPSLILPVHVLLPGQDASSAQVRLHLFRLVFGPVDPNPHIGGAQKAFLDFMRYIHTYCPLLPVVEAALIAHTPCTLELELAAMLAVALGYVGWNFFCWWLLREAPYPLQLRVYRCGTKRALVFYVVLVFYAASLILHCRLLRRADGAVARTLAALPILGIIWSTSGLRPFKAALARYQGVDPGELWGKPKH